MRTLILSLLSSLALAACGEPGSTAPATPDPAAAPTPIERVKVTADVALLRKSVQMYRADHDNANPPDLASLGVADQLTYPLTTYEYDPATGKVRAPDFPGL